MKCSICGKISATNQDHLDCIQMRRVELEDEDFKSHITEKLDMAKSSDLGVEIRAVLEHLAMNKDSAGATKTT